VGKRVTDLVGRSRMRYSCLGRESMVYMVGTQRGSWSHFLSARVKIDQGNGGGRKAKHRYTYTRQIQEWKCCLEVLVFPQVVALRSALGLGYRQKKGGKAEQATNLKAASTNPTPVEGTNAR